METQVDSKSEEKITEKYVVRTGAFEGPFDLLLNLIESRKLFVNEVSLASVTEEYVKYVRSLPALALDEATQFILIAATLILIKSRSLLPNLNLTPDEKENIVDLEVRMKLYELVTNVSQKIKLQFGEKSHFVIKERKINETDVIFVPDAKINVSLIHELAKGLLDKLPKKEVKLPEVEIRRVISLEEMIDDLTNRITESFQTSFTDFVRSANIGAVDAKEKKTNIIVSFLAMLELVRGGIIDVIQNMNEEEIQIVKREKELEINEE